MKLWHKTDWLTKCLYCDIWQTADEITMHYINVYINVSLYDRIYSLQYTVLIIELVWIFVQQPRNKITVTQVSLVCMQLSVMCAASEVMLLWCCGLR